MELEILYLINNQWTAPWLDYVMVVSSSASLWLPLLIAAVVAIVLFGGFRGRAFVACLALTLAVGDGLVVQCMKDAVKRPRPHKTVSGIRILDLAKANPRVLALGQPLQIKYSKAERDPVGGRSFPSGHAVNNISVATVFAVFFRWGWLVYFPAMLVSYSRIYVGSHWPGDILVSVFLGVGVALLSTALAGWAWSRWGGRILPKVFANHPRLLSN